MQRTLRCTARITSSRDSLDEEQLEQQAAAGRQAVNGRPRAPDAAPAALQQAAAARQSRLEEQQQQRQQQRQQQQQQQQQPQLQQPAAQAALPAGSAGQASPRQLSVQELQQLTELHVEDAYALGVVGSATELAKCLSTDLRDGLTESPVRAAPGASRRGGLDSVDSMARCASFVASLLRLVLHRMLREAAAPGMHRRAWHCSWPRHSMNRWWRYPPPRPACQSRAPALLLSAG